METKNRINIIRLQLESSIIKSMMLGELSDKESERFEKIKPFFSKDAKDALELLDELIEKQSFEEQLFLSKVLEMASESFKLCFIDSEKVANISYLLEEYERQIALFNQVQLIEYLKRQTKLGRVVELDSTIMDDFKYDRTDDFKTLEDIINNIKTRGEIPTYPTGVEFFDTAFNGGLRGGQLILISGDYEAGKTTIGTQILENMTATQKVVFFCFEFTDEAYGIRRIEQPNELLNVSNMVVYNDGYHIDEIKNNIIRMNKKQKVKVFLIDSQMRIECDIDKKMNSEEKESLKFETLGKLAHKLDIIIFLIIQTSKSDSKTPFGSKKGAHEASIIIHLENIEGEQKRLKENYQARRLIVRKNKQTGKHFKEDIFLNMQAGQFEKDPQHIFKDKKYDPKAAVLKKNIIDLKDLDLDDI